MSEIQKFECIKFTPSLDAEKYFYKVMEETKEKMAIRGK